MGVGTGGRACDGSDMGIYLSRVLVLYFSVVVVALVHSMLHEHLGL